MKKNLGIILVVIGALALIITMLPFAADLADCNPYTIGALVLTIVGLILHIQLNKKVG